MIDDKDRAAIDKLNSIFSPRATKVFEKKELDNDFWEEGLRLGYSDETALLETSNEVSNSAVEEVIEDLKTSTLQPGTPVALRGVFEGSFIPIEVKDN